MSNKEHKLEPVSATDAVGGGQSGQAYIIPISTDSGSDTPQTFQVRKDGVVVAEFTATGLTFGSDYGVTLAKVTIPGLATAARQALVDPDAGALYWDTSTRQLAFWSGAEWRVLDSVAEE